MPWHVQAGMVACELSRAASLLDQGGGDEVNGCIRRARELMGILESAPAIPPGPLPALAEAARGLAARDIARDAALVSRFRDSLTATCLQAS